jgi:hypothetical protein
MPETSLGGSRQRSGNTRERRQEANSTSFKIQIENCKLLIFIKIFRVILTARPEGLTFKLSEAME